MANRVAEREDFDVPTRLTLSEVDHDRADRKFETIFEKFDDQTKMIGRQSLAFIGMTISVFTLAAAIVAGVL